MPLILNFSWWGSPHPSRILSPLHSPFSSSMITWETGGQSLQDCSPTTTHHPPRSTIRWYVLSSFHSTSGPPPRLPPRVELSWEGARDALGPVPGPCTFKSLWLPPPFPPGLKGPRTVWDHLLLLCRAERVLPCPSGPGAALLTSAPEEGQG